MAFRHVLGIKQTKFGDAIKWLDNQIEESRPRGTVQTEWMEAIYRRGNEVFRGYKF